MVPFLTLAVGLSQHAAEATSLVVVLPTAIVASLELRRRGVGDLGLALRFGVVGALGGVVGALLALALPAARCGSSSPSSSRSSACGSSETVPRMTGDGQALVDALAATIQARVLSGDIPTGTRLRQESLAAEFASAGRRCGRRCGSCRRAASSRCSRTGAHSSAGRARATCARPTRCAPSSRGSRRHSRRRASGRGAPEPARPPRSSSVTPSRHSLLARAPAG